MPLFDPEILASWTDGRWTAPPVSPLSGFTIDTRQLRGGQIFVAIKTGKRDGHDFLLAAEHAGASGALVATANPALKLPQLVVADPLAAFQTIAREHRRTFGGRVVGISGSAGKTSTKNLLALLLAPRGGLPDNSNPADATGKCHIIDDTRVFREGGKGGEPEGVLATEGNLNNHLGVPLTLTRLDAALHNFAVIEAGISAPREMAPLAAMIEPEVAIITLVAPAHTAELGGLGGVAAEKAVLAAAVRTGGVAIFPKQCAQFPAFRELNVRQMVLERTDIKSPEVSSSGDNLAVPFSISHRDDSTEVSIAFPDALPATFAFRRVSDGMAQNAALAISAARWLGISCEKIQERLVRWAPAKLRGELRHESGRLLYLDCYNANPASMADALDAFYAVAPAGEPRLFVLGGMEELGPESEMFHRALGRSLRVRPQDFLFIIGDQAEAVRSGALDSGSHSEQIALAASIETVAARVAEWRGAVFVKGSRRYELEKVLGSPGSGERERVDGNPLAHARGHGSSARSDRRGVRGDSKKIDSHA